MASRYALHWNAGTPEAEWVGSGWTDVRRATARAFEIIRARRGGEVVIYLGGTYVGKVGVGGWLVDGNGEKLVKAHVNPAGCVVANTAEEVKARIERGDPV